VQAFTISKIDEAEGDYGGGESKRGQLSKRVVHVHDAKRSAKVLYNIGEDSISRLDRLLNGVRSPHRPGASPTHS
jgi:hypothetical protein